MKTLFVACALAVLATAAAADILPPGSYVQSGEGGDHAATSWAGGCIVIFDGQPFVWNGSFYTNGLSVLEFIEILDGEYGWLLVTRDQFDTGIVTGGR